MLYTERIYLRDLQLEDTESMFDLRTRNRLFLQPFEPTVTHFTYEVQKEAIENVIKNREAGLGYGFGVFLRTSNHLIGRVNLNNVVRGAWNNCTIGYFIDQDMQGKGYMTEAVKLAVYYAFKLENLHRVEAGIMPSNIGSFRVIEKSGFNYIGLSKYHLKINGKWEDHYIYAITTEDWTPYKIDESTSEIIL